MPRFVLSHHCLSKLLTTQKHHDECPESSANVHFEDVVKLKSIITDKFYSVLILLSIASFYPQCARILMRQDSGGVSPSYALCNVIVATHQFSLDLFFIVTSDEADLVIHRTPSVGDWLNLIQFAVVCVGHFIM